MPKVIKKKDLKGKVHSFVSNEKTRLIRNNKPLNHLTVNSKRYFLEKNEDKGVKDLGNIINVKKVEGAWAFNPEQDIWYNVAGKRYYSRFGKKRKIGVKILPFNFSEFGKKIILYHTHPGFINPGTYGQSENYPLETFEQTLPSIPDIKAFSNISLASPDCDLTFIVKSSNVSSITQILKPEEGSRIIVEYTKLKEELKDIVQAKIKLKSRLLGNYQPNFFKYMDDVRVNQVEYRDIFLQELDNRLRGEIKMSFRVDIYNESSLLKETQYSTLKEKYTMPDEYEIPRINENLYRDSMKDRMGYIPVLDSYRYEKDSTMYKILEAVLDPMEFINDIGYKVQENAMKIIDRI